MSDTSIPTYQFSQKYLADIPFQILRFEELPNIATQPFPRRRTFYEIFWITEGEGVHHIDFEEWTLTKNTFYFISPGQVNFWDIREQVSGYAILFTQDFIATYAFEQMTPQNFDFFHQATRHPLIEIGEESVAQFNSICEQMLSEYNHDHYGRLTLLQCHLTILLIHAQRQYSEINHSVPNTASDRLIAEYHKLIERHFTDVKNIEDYARMLHVTSGHLRDMTREKLGVTPGHLLNNRIILEVKRRLTHSDQTIAEIAHQLKFDDPSYFSRFFKRETGFTPSAFRQQICEKYQHPRD